MSNRVRELRERQNLNQEELGARVGVSRQTVIAWEKGQREPSVTQLTALAGALGVPLELLLRQPDVQPGRERPNFLYRADKRGALTSTDEELMVRLATNYALVERIAGVLPVIPESRHIDGFHPELVERVAEETRDWLGVENVPLGDAIDLIERRGLKVIRIRLPENVFGLSAYTDELGGIIFVNTHQNGRELPYERQAFTAMHELGHLIFHRREYEYPSTITTKKDPREEVADYFAGAVLISARAIKDDVRGYEGSWIPEPLLKDLKLRYGASVQTILYRLKNLGFITDKQFGQQFGLLKRKYSANFNEPPQPICPPSKAKPRIEILVFGALVTEKIGESKAAEILGWPQQRVRTELENWLPEEDDV